MHTYTTREHRMPIGTVFQLALVVSMAMQACQAQTGACPRFDNTAMFGNDLVDGCANSVPNACECARQCAAHNDCHGWTYIKQRNRWCPGGCFLKAQPLPAMRPDRSMISGRRPVIPQAPAPAQPQQRLLATAMSATGCAAEDGTDRFGDDLDTNGCSNVHATADACCAACQARAGCVSWAWIKPTAANCPQGTLMTTTTAAPHDHITVGCFLKGGRGGTLTPNADVVSGANDAATTAPATEASPAMPEVPPPTVPPPAQPPSFVTLPLNVNPGAHILPCAPYDNPSTADPTNPTPELQQQFAEYSSIVLGAPLSTPPDVLWCGLYSPATAPAITYGQAPGGSANGCVDNPAAMPTFNDPKYWTRPVDLPVRPGVVAAFHIRDQQMNKFWIPSRIFTYDVSPQPIDYINCDGSQALPTLSSGMPFNSHWKQNIAVSSFWYVVPPVLHLSSLRQGRLAAGARHPRGASVPGRPVREHLVFQRPGDHIQGDRRRPLAPARPAAPRAVPYPAVPGAAPV